MVDNIPDIRSGRDHGPYSGHCKVCWYPIYTLWFDSQPPPGTCVYECTNAADCPDALGRAELKASLLAYHDKS